MLVREEWADIWALEADDKDLLSVLCPVLEDEGGSSGQERCVGSEDWPILHAVDSGEKLRKSMGWKEMKRLYKIGEEEESKWTRGLRSTIWE